MVQDCKGPFCFNAHVAFCLTLSKSPCMSFSKYMLLSNTLLFITECNLLGLMSRDVNDTGKKKTNNKTTACKKKQKLYVIKIFLRI